MFSRLRSAAILLFLISCAPHRQALWDTDDDFRRFEPKVLELIAGFRADPLGPEAEKQRGLVLAWATQVPYIGFTRYAKYLSEMDKHHPYYGELVDAFTFGEIELKLRDKSAKPGEPEIAAASLRSMLGVYAKLKAAGPDAKWELLDGYAAMEKEGMLLAHFDGIKESGMAVKGEELPSEYAQVEYRLRLLGPSGEHVQLGAWKGKSLVVAYVSGTCPHCRNVAKRLRAELKPAVETILVFNDRTTDGQARTFEDSTGTGYPHYRDYDGQFRNTYGGGIVPVTLFIRKDGSASRAGGVIDSTVTRLITEANRSL